MKTIVVLYLCGVISVGVISAVLIQSGWNPRVLPCCPDETAQLMRVIESSVCLLSVVSGTRLVWKSIKRVFTSPSNALYPILNAAAVVALALLLPCVLNSASRMSNSTDTMIKTAQVISFF